MTSAQGELREWWRPAIGVHHLVSQDDLLSAVERIREPAHLVLTEDRSIAVGFGGERYTSSYSRADHDLPLVGILPPMYPEWLGDRGFAETHGCRFPYVVGEMARGIATAEMVVAAAQAGFMGFLGSAGLQPQTIAEDLDHIRSALGPTARNWGANLIHSPHEPDLEQATVDLFLERDVRRVSASAFMDLQSSIVRYMSRGLAREQDGRIRRRNYVFAKVSHPNTARAFLSPPPDAMLKELVANGRVTADEAELAGQLPVAEDITVEADSGGHTDNRPLTALFPTILGLRNELIATQGFSRNIRVGAAGGFGTPAGLAAAFGLGAAYVLTGSVNQAATQSGLSTDGRAMLAGAGVDDIAMAPAADMFEIGVKVQVLKRGTMFAVRAQKLYDLYRSYDCLDDIPSVERARLERDVFRAPSERIWQSTRKFFEERNPAEVVRAEREPRHLMALVFRWYLFMGSQWAREGDTERRADYQIWCGPAMGAFNAWARGSYLEPTENRCVAQIGRNLLEGAAVIARAQQFRSFGVAIPPAGFVYRPRPLG